MVWCVCVCLEKKVHETHPSLSLSEGVSDLGTFHLPFLTPGGIFTEPGNVNNAAGGPVRAPRVAGKVATVCRMWVRI